MRSAKRSKRYAASCGPAAASGWYCTEKLVSAPVGVAQLEALDDVVVEADVADRHLAERRSWSLPSSGRVDREAVVVGGDLDLAGGAVHHRLVDAAVAVLQLVGAEAERAAEELVAEADAEVGQPGAQGALQQLDLRGRGRRVAGAVGEEQPVGADRLHVLERSTVAGQHVHLDAALGSSSAGVLALMPRSIAATVNRRSPCAGTTYASAVETASLRLAPAISPDCSTRSSSAAGVGLGGGDADAHRAALAQVAGQRAGVDAADADDALVAQLVVEAADAAPVGRHAGGVADDVAGDPDARGLGVLVVHAGVADVRGRHHDDLAVVAAGRSASPGSRTCRWRRPLRRRSRPRRRRTHRGRCDRPRGPAVPMRGLGWGRQSHAVPPSPPHGTDR